MSEQLAMKRHDIVTILALATIGASACTSADPQAGEGGETTGDTSAGPGGSSGSDGGSGTGASGSTGDGSSDDGGVDPPMICHEPGVPGSTWFVEVTEEVGLGKTDALEPLATSIVAGDLDGDRYPDLFAAVFPAQREVPGDRRMRFVFMNRPDPDDSSKRVFVDATEESGLFATRDGAGGRGLSVASLGDIDNDGDLDVVGCPGSGEDSVVDPCAAFLNDGSGRFELAAPSELESEVFWVPSSVMLDWDRDGVLDFWPGTVGQWAYGPALTSAPRLYRGLGDGLFVDVAAEAGLPATAIGGAGDWRINFGLTSCDVDQDGDRDVLAGNYYQQPNYAWIDQDGEFINGAQSLAVDHDAVEPTSVGGHTFSITCGDIDDDGDVDLMTSEVRHAWVATESDRSELLRNDSPADQALAAAFVRPGNAATGMDRQHIGSAWTEGDNIAIFADVDLDGRKDVLLASSNYPQQSASDPDWTHTWLWHQRSDGTFEDATPTTPWAGLDQQSLEGPSLVDYDLDGDLDLVIGTGTFNSTYLGLTNTVHVYRNEIGQDSNWTNIRLTGGGAGQANRSGIGAIVRVTAGGRTMMQEVLGSWGHSNTQSDVTLTFGLGEACMIDAIEVRWPDVSGSVEVFENVLGNYAIELVQGEGEVRYLVE